jgi:type IV pilus assembly protein PilA
MNIFPRTNGGFTLIELMIVIAIVAILVALAVPAYQDYTIRTKVAECINNGNVAKLGISEFRDSSGSFPATPANAGIGTSTTVISGSSEFCNVFIYTSGNSFDISVNTAAITDEIVGLIQPSMTGVKHPTSSNTDWTCTQGSTDPGNVKYLPSTCRGTT